MRLIKEGKTKDVYETDNGAVLILLFKDNITGTDGKEDGGGNEVIGTKLGVGAATLGMSARYFKLLEENSIKTHMVRANQQDGDDRMMVYPAKTIGGDGLEFIKRYRATGSLRRRFPKLFKEGDHINITEITCKDDAAGDPPMSDSIIIAAGLLDETELTDICDLFDDACDLIREDLEMYGLELWDIKLEFGLINYEDSGSLWAVIDEIGPGNMRVYKDGKELEKLELARIVLEGDD